MRRTRSRLESARKTIRKLEIQLAVQMAQNGEVSSVQEALRS